jgi:hypothetical protein
VRGFDFYRVDRERGSVFAADSFLLANALDAKLGPALGGNPPRVVLKDAAGNWSVWDLADLVQARVEVRNGFFGVGAWIHLEGLAPGSEDPRNWDVTFAMDRDDARWSSLGYWLPIDFLTANPGHSIIARVRPRGTSDTEYRAVAMIPAGSDTERLVRQIFVAVLITGLLGFASVLVGSRLRRARRLRNREVPYVVGEAILEPNRFYGREDVLKTLTNSIATGSYALVGGFRIGKTSIQHQLTHRLRHAIDPRHVYLPVFIDLQSFSGVEAEFFHFLGEHLQQLARDDGVPSEVLDKLQFGQVNPAAGYTLRAFVADFKALLAYWDRRYAPRQPIVVLQIDEMGFLGNLSSTTRFALRSLFIHNPQIKTVLSGKEVPCRDENTTSQWWNFFTELPVKPLTSDESRRLIVNPAKGLFDYESQTVDEIMIEARREPFRIQRLCANLLNYMYSQSRLRTTITPDDFRGSLLLTGSEG